MGGESSAEAKIPETRQYNAGRSPRPRPLPSEALYEKLHSTNRSGVAKALDFSAIVNEKRGQHLPGTREWVFEAVPAGGPR